MKTVWTAVFAPVAVTLIAACAVGSGGSEDEDENDIEVVEADDSEVVEEATDALGKTCTATCTVNNVGDGDCPATMGGYGYTTFLGGCKKACNKARDDAASKLPPGCVIHNCSTTGC